MITVKINNVDKASLITFNSLVKIDNLNSQVDSLTFSIKNTENNLYKPELGQEVLVENGSTKVFGGIIVKIDDDTSNSGMIIYKIYCNDYSQEFKKSLVTTRFTNTTLFTILAYLIDNFADGFTYNNIAGDINIASFSFNRLNLMDSIQKLSDALSYVWYIDYDKDLHFFPKNNELAPFNLSDDSNNYIKDSISVTEDLTQIRNSILVQGGSAVSGATRTEHITTDGENSAFNLINKYAEVPTITVAGVSKTVGVDNVDDPDDYDILWDYNQKSIRFPNIQTIGQDISITGLYEYPILVKIRNPISIGEYGEYEFAITDKTILSQEQAIERAKAELQTYQSELYDGSFKTYTDGLRSGQVINIQSDKRNLNLDVVIQSVTTTMTDPNATKFEYNVRFATLKSVGIIEYLQRQLRKEEIVDESSETLLNYVDFGIDSSILFSDSISASKQYPPYYWDDETETEANPLIWDYGTWD